MPLFLGEVDTSIQRYIDMEEMLRVRLDRWLCNLYFRIVRLPKELDGLQEFEVPLHYTGRMLNIPEELPLPKESRLTSTIRSNRSIRSSYSSSAGEWDRFCAPKLQAMSCSVPKKISQVASKSSNPPVLLLSDKARM